MIAPPMQPQTENRTQTEQAPARQAAPSPFVLRRDWILLVFCGGCFLLLFLIGLKDLLLGLFGLWRGQ
jgi:hypothetical protein